MRQVISIFLIIGLTVVTLFGIWFMHPMGNHAFSCLASLVEGKQCLSDNDNFDFLIFHLNTLKKLSTAVFNGIIFLAFLSLVALALFLNQKLGKLINQIAFTPKYWVKRFSGHLFSSFQPKFIHWLAIRENSPNFS